MTSDIDFESCTPITLAPIYAQAHDHEPTTMQENSKIEDISGNEVETVEARGDLAEWTPSKRFYMAMLALATLTLMVALDGTILAVALPTISHELGGTALQSFWAGTSFLLCSAVVQPLSASLSHIFGRMPITLGSVVLFLVGVLLAGLSKSFAMLLSGRSIQGLGGGGILTMTEVILTDLVPLKYRGQWGGIIGGMWSLGSVCGPIVGGAFVGTNWRWIFWLNLPFIGITIVLVPLALRLSLDPSTIMAKLRRVDWVGSLLFLLSSTTFLVALTWGGTMYPWQSWKTLLPLLLGITGLVLFAAFEAFFAVEPMMRGSVFANTTANLAYLTEMIHGLIMWCVLFYLPLYFEAVKGFSPVVSGVGMLPSMLTIAPSAVIIGQLITKTGTYIWTGWTGWILQTLGLGLLVLLGVETPMYEWILICLVCGIGLGILLPSLLIQLQAASRNEDMAFAVATFIFFRSLGQAAGVAIGSVIFQNEILQRLLEHPELKSRAKELAQDATALMVEIRNTTDGAYRQQLRQIYASSFVPIWIVMCSLSAACLVLTWWVRPYSISVGLETDQRLREAEMKK